MAWLFKNASFRGIGFYVDTSDRDGGRTLIAHTIPQGEGELWEDVGPESDVVQIEAYLVGAPAQNLTSFNPQIDSLQTRNQFPSQQPADPTLFYWRDRLLQALERKGPGTLEHPLYGILWVRARRWRFTEQKGEQGFIRASIEFVRERQFAPTITVSTKSPTGAAAERSDALEAAAGADVTEGLVTAGAETARDASSGELTKLGNALKSMKAAGEQAAELSRQAVGMINDAKALATIPADMVSRVVTSVRDVERAFNDALGALAAYEVLLELVPDVWGSPAEDNNAGLVSSLTRSAAAGGALRAIVRVEWDSYEQAVARRGELFSRLESLARTASDTLYEELSEYQATLTALVPPEGENLPRVGTFVPPTSMPALVVAQRVYGDATREAEIIARNRIRNPNLVPGGRALEVLVDGSR